MARILISEPVAETRELIERLVRRLGHQVLPESSLEHADALVFEPSCRRGLGLAVALRERQPGAALVACSALPSAPGLPRLEPLATITQPFSPADLERVLGAALLRSAAA